MIVAIPKEVRLKRKNRCQTCGKRRLRSKMEVRYHTEIVPAATFVAIAGETLYNIQTEMYQKPGFYCRKCNDE